MKDTYRSKDNILLTRILTVIVILGLIAVAAVVINIKVNERKAAQYSEIIQKYADKGGLIYGADDSAPPLRFVDDDGIYKGVTVDLMSQLSLELGLEIRCVPYRWENALESLKEGKTDMCDMFESEERSQYYVFSNPIYNLRTVMVMSKGDDFTLDDIDHLTIATQKGDYANGYLQEHYPNAKLIFVHDVGAALDELMAERVDAVIGDEPVLLYYADKREIENEITFFGTSLYEEPVVIALNKNEKDLLPVINDAIERINSTDALEKIQQKWFTISTPITFNKEDTLPIKIVMAGFVLAMVIATLIYLNSRRLQKMVEDRTRELNGKNEELQFIFDSMPEGIVLMDSRGNVINGNYSFFEKTDNGKEDMKCSSFLKNLCNTDGCTGDPRACGKGCIAFECLENEEDITRKIQLGARTFEMKASLTKITDLAGDERAVLIMVRDITLDEINDKKLLQNSKMAAVGQLAAGMAHQIKNPLGVIRTQSYLLRRGKSEDEYVTNSLDYIDDSVKRAASIIDNVMNFWRMSDDTLKEIKVKEFLEALKTLNEGNIRNKDAELNISCSDDLTILSYPESLKHIFHNLISNAIDALGEKGRVDIEVEDEEKAIIVSVSDNGCGIRSEDLPNLYNPFFTTKEPGEGTGLGMFVIYSEVEKIGGSIEVKTEEGKGTSFRVVIPKEGKAENE